jgi:hypothetical protein
VASVVDAAQFLEAVFLASFRSASGVIFFGARPLQGRRDAGWICDALQRVVLSLPSC